jgi:hypothetical protein
MRHHGGGPAEARAGDNGGDNKPNYPGEDIAAHFTKPFTRLFASLLTRLAANVFLAAFGFLSTIEGLPIARYERFRTTVSGSAQ